VDREAVPRREDEQSETRAAGYFAIVVRYKDIEVLDRRDDLFIGVFDGRCRLLYRHCTPIALHAGARIEQTIRLDRDDLEAEASKG